MKQGETIGAASVVGIKPTGDDPEATQIPNPTGSRPRFVLEGADLSVEKRTERLAVSERGRFGGPLARQIIYLLSGLLIVASIGSRLRDRVPPEVRDRRQRLVRSVKEVERAASALSKDQRSPEALQAVVGTLRSMAREVKQAKPGSSAVDGLEEFFTECEDRIYAPSGEGTDPSAVANRATSLARALEEAGR